MDLRSAPRSECASDRPAIRAKGLCPLRRHVFLPVLCHIHFSEHREYDHKDPGKRQTNDPFNQLLFHRTSSAPATWGSVQPSTLILQNLSGFVNLPRHFFRAGAHRERNALEQCQISDSYFELRSDYDRLCHGVYWLKLLDTAILPDTPAPELFIVTLRALAHLNYGELPPALVTFAFESHFMRLNGLSPRMNACVRCGRPVDGDARFDADLGGVLCERCPSTAPAISNGARRILMKLPRTQFDKFQLLAERPEWPEAARLMRSTVNLRMRMERFAPPLYDAQAH